MKFSDYVKDLVDFLEKHPESGEMTAIYAADDEGNGYQQVGWSGTLGHFDGDYRGEFISDDNLKEEPDEYEDGEYPLNAVCVN